MAPEDPAPESSEPENPISQKSPIGAPYVTPEVGEAPSNPPPVEAPVGPITVDFDRFGTAVIGGLNALEARIRELEAWVSAHRHALPSSSGSVTTPK